MVVIKRYCQCYRERDGCLFLPFEGMADAWTVFDRESYGYFLCSHCQEEVHTKTVERVRRMEDDDERNSSRWGVKPGYNKAGERVSTLDCPTYDGKVVVWVGGTGVFASRGGFRA